MTRDEALDYLQDENYAFQCLEDELGELEADRKNWESERVKEIYATMENMIESMQKNGQLVMF